MGACIRVYESEHLRGCVCVCVDCRRELICLSIYSASLHSTMQQQPLDKEASLWDSNEGGRWRWGEHIERTEGLLVGYRGLVWRVEKVE